MTRAVFLDRDGTIAEDVNYCSSVEDFHLLPTVAKAIRLCNENAFKVIVITNQSGLARGYFTKDTLAQIHHKMKEELREKGAVIDAIYYCPHHPDDNCACRKPKAGLLNRAAQEMGLDLNWSYMIGDMQKDIDVGRAVGCKTILVTTGPENGANVNGADYVAESLLDAAEWICMGKRAEEPV